mmetsp:Transcript_53189/g.60958  ORF Transcript_53189/g.60958 Transcript_53189/m.60958 type:complete len:222 (-) Transcript_53189:1418-2083(-)|eukprot:CAMPEP_0114977686 /NCGR_PEP_ID=MMETSP0216-20121206/3377_1 /TAXON_ID=223996 /ORGANISM="Protocruzia adherens, Strain Boccale" /LENGTH=221 /DNA_ID=CAMNT_0002338775 /DNA_START=160 /DNA_END=825 /DNA_ORIENTATION=+
MSINEMYAQTYKLTHDVDHLLAQLHNNHSDKSEILDELRLKRFHLENNIKYLQSKVNAMSPIPATWTAKLSQLQQTQTNVEKELDRAHSFYRNRVEYQNQRELLYGSDLRRRGVNGAGNPDYNHMLQAQERLEESKRVMDTIVETGSAIKDALGNQSRRVRNINNQAFDLFSTIANSETLLKVIGTRQLEDKYLTYGLMIMTLLVIFVMYYYVKPMLQGLF